MWSRHFQDPRILRWLEVLAIFRLIANKEVCLYFLWTPPTAKWVFLLSKLKNRRCCIQNHVALVDLAVQSLGNPPPPPLPLSLSPIINHHDVFSCALAQFRMQALMGTEAQIHNYISIVFFLFLTEILRLNWATIYIKNSGNFWTGIWSCLIDCTIGSYQCTNLSELTQMCFQIKPIFDICISELCNIGWL